MIKGLPSKKTNLDLNFKSESSSEVKEKVKEDPVKESIEETLLVESLKTETPKAKPAFVLTLDNTEAIAKQQETDISFDPAKDLGFSKEFYDIEGFNAEMFESNVMQLAEQLQEENPKIRGYLSHIMKNLHGYPSLNYLLSDKQLGLIVAGFKHQRKVEIAAPKPAKVSAAKNLEKII